MHQIAEGYLKKCNTIWIAANINRAVDDGTAKKLLGDNFRRQVRLPSLIFVRELQTRSVVPLLCDDKSLNKGAFSQFAFMEHPLASSLLRAPQDKDRG